MDLIRSNKFNSIFKIYLNLRIEKILKKAKKRLTSLLDIKRLTNNIFRDIVFKQKIFQSLNKDKKLVIYNIYKML